MHQETAGHSTSGPLTLIRTVLCSAKSHTNTNLCVCVRCCGRVRACSQGSVLCTQICVCVCMGLVGRECYDINLLGTDSAVCWHVSSFHADNVKYLSTGGCGHPR